MVPNLKTDRLLDAPQTPAPSETVSPPPRPNRAWRGGDSPARRLQLELERSWAAAPRAERWSTRRSLVFILVTNGLLWTALIWGASRIF